MKIIIYSIQMGKY